MAVIRSSDLDFDTIKANLKTHFQKKSEDLMNAIDMQLESNNDARMPISNNSKTQIIKGRQPTFQES